MNHRAAAIITEGPKVLLVRRIRDGNEYWVLPGGTVEDGETPEQACLREIMEETGLEISSLNLALTLRNREREEYYFFAEKRAGTFRLGEPEKSRNCLTNRYELVWVDKTILGGLDIRPSEIKKYLQTQTLNAISDHSLEPNEFEPNRTTVYKKLGNTELKLHIFIPPDHKSSYARPAIVFFFGGGWNSGTPSQFYPHCEYLASRGMVAISAEYRVKSRDNTTPRECVEDGKSAIRWVREHHQQLGIDPDQVLAGGGSAGGQVAAATGTTDGFEGTEENLSVSSRPEALVLFNPVFDNGPTGYGHERVREFWQDFSPMHNISKTTPPTIVFLGCNDNLIPVATAEEYKRRMEDNGRRCDLHLYEGQPHGFFNYTNREFFDKTVREMDRFLVSLSFLEPKTQNESLEATATSPAP